MTTYLDHVKLKMFEISIERDGVQTDVKRK